MTRTTGRGARGWNHNLHYHPLILRNLPTDCRRALDVGCGDGNLAMDLAAAGVPEVIGIDQDAACIARARQPRLPHGVVFLHDDFLRHEFAPASLDLITSVASLHHMDAAAALARMRRLLRPGGRLVIIGLARSRYPADLPADILGAAYHRLHILASGYTEVTAPTRSPPPYDYAEVRHLFAVELPGGKYRRRVLWRYSLTWTKPTTPGCADASR